MTKELMKNNAALQTKIENVSAAIGYQEKNDTNQHSRYSFTSNEQMMTALRSALIECKIGLTMDVIDYEENTFQSDKGRLTIRSIVRIKVTITDLETGFSKESLGVGAEQDTQGKSMQQAITQAFKYWCFKNFKVSSQMEKDPDMKSEEVIVKKSTPKPAPKATLSASKLIEAITKIKAMNKSSELLAVHKKYGHIKEIKDALSRRKKELGL